MAFIVVLTIKMIFAWNPPTAGAPGPSGQTLYSDTNHNIGIGTLYPNSKLEIFSTSSDSILELSRGPGTTTSTIFKVGADTAFVIQNQSTDMFAIKNGNVGINTTNPNEKLTIDGSISVQELSSAPSETSGYGKIYAIEGIGGLDSYTKLLLHADGTGASFTDSSASAKTITANGDATQSSTQSKFGGKSAYFDGTGDYLSIPDSEDWNFGSGDFTIDGWVNLANTNSFGSIFQQYVADNNEFKLAVTHIGGGVYALHFGINSGETFSIYDTNSFGTGWHHAAVVRNGNTFTIYRDGVSVASASYSGAMPNLNSSPWIGRLLSNVDYWTNSYLDELRVSKGIARWTSDFTPPTSQYSASGLFFKSSSGEEIQL